MSALSKCFGLQVIAAWLDLKSPLMSHQGFFFITFHCQNRKKRQNRHPLSSYVFLSPKWWNTSRPKNGSFWECNAQYAGLYFFFWIPSEAATVNLSEIGGKCPLTAALSLFFLDKAQSSSERNALKIKQYIITLDLTDLARHLTRQF